MGIEEFAGVTNKILNVTMTESTEAFVVASVPLGDYKDAKNGFPKVRLIFSELSPERRILKIVDLNRIGDGYELVASCTPDYERVAQDGLESMQKETCLYEEICEPDLEILAGQDEATVFRVTVQNTLANTLGEYKIKRMYKTM